MLSTDLPSIFKELSKASFYRSLVRQRVIKIVLGSSVIRVFKSGTKEKLRDSLNKLIPDQILKLKTQLEFNQWHLQNVKKIFECLKTQKENIQRLNKVGLKWGHSTKIFNLFIGHLVFNSAYFRDSENLKRIKHYLHVPLDRKVFDVLRRCGVDDIPKAIKDIDRRKYYHMQNTIKEASKKQKLPSIYFDEYAWTFESL